MVNQAIYVSATPGDWEMDKSDGAVVEQVIRPTGLLDPTVEVRPAAIQVDDCLHELRARAERDERVLITVLTKRMAQELTDYYTEIGVKARYLHSDIDTLERTAILRDLRQGHFDVLIGINLLREGLDLPEVSLVAIMEADKTGFLRNTRSLIQTIGRAARNANGHVILYAEQVTPAMRQAIDETDRRRALQIAYNEANGIEPKTIIRPLEASLTELLGNAVTSTKKRRKGKQGAPQIDRALIPKRIETLRKQMKAAAKELEFERAAELRDEIRDLESFLLAAG